MTAVRPRDITAALRHLIPGATLAVKPGGQPGEFLATMPLVSAQRIGVFDADGGGHAGLLISSLLGHRVHVTASRGLRYDVRYGHRTEVTLRLHQAAWDEVFAQLIDVGYPKDQAVAVMAEAHDYPGRWAYTWDRRRAVAFHMPGGRWETADTAETEARIAAYQTRRGQMLRAPRGAGS